MVCSEVQAVCTECKAILGAVEERSVVSNAVVVKVVKVVKVEQSWVTAMVGLLGW